MTTESGIKPKDRRGISTSKAMYNSKATDPRNKTTMSTLYRYLINRTTTGKTVATGHNNYEAENKTHKKQSRVDLHQQRFGYLV